jgi:hypothetical protein
MASEPVKSDALGGEANTSLASAWRTFARIATGIAILTSPVVFLWFHDHNGWSTGWSIAATILVVAAFRGIIDVLLRRAIPWPSLFGTAEKRLTDEDATNRLLAWFWR